MGGGYANQLVREEVLWCSSVLMLGAAAKMLSGSSCVCRGRRGEAAHTVSRGLAGSKGPAWCAGRIMTGFSGWGEVRDRSSNGADLEFPCAWPGHVAPHYCVISIGGLAGHLTVRAIRCTVGGAGVAGERGRILWVLGWDVQLQTDRITKAFAFVRLGRYPDDPAQCGQRLGGH